MRRNTNYVRKLYLVNAIFSYYTVYNNFNGLLLSLCWDWPLRYIVDDYTVIRHSTENIRCLFRVDWKCSIIDDFSMFNWIELSICIHNCNDGKKIQNSEKKKCQHQSRFNISSQWRVIQFRHSHHDFLMKINIRWRWLGAQFNIFSFKMNWISTIEILALALALASK